MKSVIVLLVWLIVLVMSDIAASQETAEEIAAKIRKNLALDCECVEFVKGEILTSAGSAKEFVLARTISTEDGGRGFEKVRVTFTSAEIDEENSNDSKTYTGKGYLSFADLESLAPARQWAWLPSLERARTVSKGPTDRVLSMQIVYFFINLYAYLGRYNWQFDEDGKLIGIPKSRSLPKVEISYFIKENTYLIRELILHWFGEYRFSFLDAEEQYKEVRSGLYRPTLVEVTYTPLRKTKVKPDKISLAGWLIKAKDGTEWLFQPSKLFRMITIPSK